jgi:DNA invertase Pin-like site-specific DNA recombinase
LSFVAAYYRTSSVTNEDRHFRQRQQDAVDEYAQRVEYQIAVTRWDIHTRNSNVIDRPGFSELLTEVQSKNISVILIENASRFARDLLHQKAGVQALSKLNIQIIPVDAPETFTEDNPNRVLIWQVLGAVSEFEKASLVSRLRAARDKKRSESGKCEERKSFSERDPEVVAAAKRYTRRKSKSIRKKGKNFTLREIAEVLQADGYTNKSPSSAETKS